MVRRLGMDLHAEETWQRLDRWVRADGTPEELDALRRWIEASPELSALAEAMRTASRPAGTDVQWNTRGRWQQLQRDMRRADRPLRIAETVAGRQVGARRWRWAVAAAAAVAAVVGASLVMKPMSLQQGKLATAPPMREIVTRRGERAVLDLPDGSRVVIAPESRLRIPGTYRLAAGPRDVYLDRGDAIFTVEHDAARPFRVTTAYGVAEDLGTEFLVTADTATPAMQVVVVAGEVGLSRTPAARGPQRRQPLVTLGANELGRIDSAGNATVSANVQTTPYVAWANGTLVFDHTPLDETIHTLGRWYDLDIRLADSTLARRQVTATIQHQSAPRVLEGMAMSLNLTLTQQGTTYILSSGGK